MDINAIRAKAQLRFAQRVPEGYVYKGFTYSSDEERMSDNIKIYHEVRDAQGKLSHMDWSPYDTPTVEEFQMWVDLDRPNRIGCGPLRSEDLLTIAKERGAA
jgi:hypothetical protein